MENLKSSPVVFLNALYSPTQKILYTEHCQCLHYTAINVFIYSKYEFLFPIALLLLRQPIVTVFSANGFGRSLLSCIVFVHHFKDLCLWDRTFPGFGSAQIRIRNTGFKRKRIKCFFQEINSFYRYFFYSKTRRFDGASFVGIV